MRRFAFIGCLALAIALITTQSAFAARIYNLLPISVHVTGVLGGIGVGSAKLEPGQRSDSLGWGSANYVRVDPVTNRNITAYDKPLCGLNFGVHAEIQGGNYMTIGYRGDQVVCTVCNSSHGVVSHAAERTAYGWKGESRTGC